MDEVSRSLHQSLLEFIHVQREEVRSRFARLNPWYENLVPWRQRAEYWLGEDRNVTLYESTTLIGDVDIGANTWVGPFCLLDGSGGLTIGQWCSISTGVQLLTHDTAKWALSGGVADYEYRPVSIGDRVFVGSHAVVTKGVHIAGMSVIAAGAVVTQSFPERSVVAGVPARRIGRVVGEGKDVQLEYS